MTLQVAPIFLKIKPQVSTLPAGVFDAKLWLWQTSNLEEAAAGRRLPWFMGGADGWTFSVEIWGKEDRVYGE